MSRLCASRVCKTTISSDDPFRLAYLLLFLSLSILVLPATGAFFGNNRLHRRLFMLHIDRMLFLYLICIILSVSVYSWLRISFHYRLRFLPYSTTLFMLADWPSTDIFPVSSISNRHILRFWRQTKRQHLVRSVKCVVLDISMSIRNSVCCLFSPLRFFQSRDRALTHMFQVTTQWPTREHRRTPENLPFFGLSSIRLQSALCSSSFSDFYIKTCFKSSHLVRLLSRFRNLLELS